MINPGFYGAKKFHRGSEKFLSFLLSKMLIFTHDSLWSSNPCTFCLEGLTMYGWVSFHFIIPSGYSTAIAIHNLISSLMLQIMQKMCRFSVMFGTPLTDDGAPSPLVVEAGKSQVSLTTKRPLTGIVTNYGSDGGWLSVKSVLALIQTIKFEKLCGNHKTKASSRPL